MSVEMTKKELATIAGYTYRRIYDIDRDLPPEKKLFALRNEKFDPRRMRVCPNPRKGQRRWS